jgi:paraquat-inducible protein B
VKTKLSPAIVGMFVLGALLLAVVAFLSFGGTNVFSKPPRFLVYFEESVSGLDPGASVKFNGVRIGRVAAINVRYDQTSKESLVRTVCEIDRNILTDSAGKQIDLTIPAELQNLIDRGLRARLNLTGITGLLFVELEFDDVHKYPANPRFMAEQYPVVPSIPSAISEVQQSIVEIVANIKKVDFATLGKELNLLLATANQKFNDLDVKALAERVGRAADAVQAIANSPEAKQTFTNLNAAIADLRNVLAKIDTQVVPAGKELTETLAQARVAIESFNETAIAARKFIATHSGLGDEMVGTLEQLNEAANAVARLADFLERNPNALLTGKKRPQ